MLSSGSEGGVMFVCVLGAANVDPEVDRVVDSDRSALIFGRLDRLNRLKSTQTIDSTLTKSDRLTRLAKRSICSLAYDGSTHYFFDVA